MNTVITVSNLSKTFKVKIRKSFTKDLFRPDFKDIYAVKNISFKIAKGESVAFLGPNGAGKTTTMKMLSGLIYPTAGDLDILGFFPFDRKREFLTKIALVMGNKSGLEWDLTPRQSFQLNQKIYQIDNSVFTARVTSLTNMLDTAHLLDIQVRKLSLGERLKMEIIAAILHNPEILFLDEPTIGLDVISKQKIRKFFRDIQKETAVTLLITSHDMSDVEKVCDRVIVINKGSIVYDDSLKTLTNEYSKEKFIKFIFKKMPEKRVLEKYGIISELGEGYVVLKTPSEKMPAVMDKITTKFKLLDIDILSTPLDEIISDLFTKTK